MAAAFGLGAAYARPRLEAALHGLGLVENATWTDAAELVFWCFQLAEWQMHVTTDPRFAASLEQTLKTLLAAIAADIDATLAQARGRPRRFLAKI